uniref:Uncharacterized protein n=1 Tax=Timema poppense TaxID=170557 RepID=A0A7R9H2C6_TIMPO|nr:unnamed protein product [Timema poppensis]
MVPQPHYMVPQSHIRVHGSPASLHGAPTTHKSTWFLILNTRCRNHTYECMVPPPHIRVYGSPASLHGAPTTHTNAISFQVRWCVLDWYSGIKGSFKWKFSVDGRNIVAKGRRDGMACLCAEAFTDFRDGYPVIYRIYKRTRTARVLQDSSRYPNTVHLTKIRTLISPSSVVELNTTSALANYATEAVLLWYKKDSSTLVDKNDSSTLTERNIEHQWAHELDVNLAIVWQIMTRIPSFESLSMSSRETVYMGVLTPSIIPVSAVPVMHCVFSRHPFFTSLQGRRKDLSRHICEGPD